MLLGLAGHQELFFCSSFCYGCQGLLHLPLKHWVLTAVRVGDFGWHVLLLGLKKIRGSWLEDFVPLPRVKLITTFGIQKEFYLMVILAWIVGGLPSSAARSFFCTYLTTTSWPCSGRTLELPSSPCCTYLTILGIVPGSCKGVCDIFKNRSDRHLVVVRDDPALSTGLD